jgi:hypothetical protein
LGDAEHTEGGQGEADEVEVSEGAAAFENLPGGQDGDDDAHWDVEPEDPLPEQALDDGPTDERAGRDGDAGDRAPGAEGLAAHWGWCGIDDQRQRQWHRYATADAL